MTDPADVHSACILIVDDCRDTASTLCELLKWKGYRHVAWTTDGRAVPDLVTRETCGLILLDMHMPEVSGLDVMRSLQAMAASANGIPVVAISGDQRYRAVSVAAGACAFLIKPFSPEQLEATIASALFRASIPLARHAANA
jgi:DNA-binding response OmpR family regulator